MWVKCEKSISNNINLLRRLYSAFIDTQSALAYMEGGNLLNHHQCAASTWMMRRQPYCARTPTTHQLTGGEETVMKPISIWGWLGGHDGQRPRGKFGQDAGVTPLLFFEGHPGIFNDHRESGPRFNISSEGRVVVRSCRGTVLTVIPNSQTAVCIECRPRTTP